MDNKYTGNWTLDDFKALEKVRNMPAGWGEGQFAFRQYNNYSVMIPAGWRSPTDTARLEAMHAEAGKNLTQLAVVILIFVVIPKLFEKYGRNKFGP